MMSLYSAPNQNCCNQCTEGDEQHHVLLCDEKGLQYEVQKARCLSHAGSALSGGAASIPRNSGVHGPVDNEGLGKKLLPSLYRD